MTQSEIAAFNSGVLTILALAESSAETMETLMILKPTRYNFAAEALRALAEEGRALLKPDGSIDAYGAQNPGPAPRPPRSHGVELVVPASAGDDGQFGLSDEEITRPSRKIIIDWLKGRTPMLASHWSRIVAGLLQSESMVTTTNNGERGG